MTARTMTTVWRLAELMARHNISGQDLAKALGKSENAISTMKRSKTMPRINGPQLDAITEALTKLSEIGEPVRGVDLLEDR